MKYFFSVVFLILISMSSSFSLILGEIKYVPIYVMFTILPLYIVVFIVLFLEDKVIELVKFNEERN